MGLVLKEIRTRGGHRQRFADTNPSVV
jgi:hypothetical protein